MARQKKDGKYLNIMLESSIYERLEMYCDEVGQTKTLAVERILRRFFDEYDKTNKTETK